MTIWKSMDRPNRPERNTDMKLNDTIYNILKWLVSLVLPGLATLYNTVAGTLGLPYADEVLAIVAAVCTFLGSVLGISCVSYNKTNVREEAE